MLLAPLAQGLFLGLSMILPIGAQNSHILSHGIKRHYHFLAATICMICDVSLIFLGVFGGAKLLSSSPVFVVLISWGGIAFLLGYAGLSFRQAYKNKYAACQEQKVKHSSSSRIAVVAATMAVTLLNPHVYLDTLVILGGVGGQYAGDEKIAFALGTMLASIIWFYSLAGVAAKLAPWLSRPKVQRVIDTLVGLVMVLIAWSLFTHVSA